MSDVVTCPTCGVQLRLPATATTIRCPKCKTVLNVAPPVTAPPPTPAVPLPLPFAKPKAKTSAGNPIAKRAKGKKAVVVDEAAEAAEEEGRKKAERKKFVSGEVEKMDEKEEIRLEKYGRLQDLIVHSRRAIAMFTWAARAQVLGLVIVLVVMLAFMMFVLIAVAQAMQGRDSSTEVGSILGATVFMALPLCGLLAAIQAILTGIGMVSVAMGTKRARYLGYIGCAVCVLHVLFVILQATRSLIGLATREFAVTTTDPLWVQLQPVFDLFGMITDLPLLSEQPTRLIFRARGYSVSWFGIFAAVFEFTRLVLVGIIAQNYAEDGKAVELGYRSYKAIGRIFYLTLFAGVARLICAFAFDWAPPNEAFLVLLGLGSHAIITFASYLGLALCVLGQAQALDDTTEVVDAVRFAAETENLEV